MSKYAVYFITLVAIVTIVESEDNVCRKNEIWSNCPKVCRPTCKNPKPTGVCTEVCQQPGCICSEGFVLDRMNCVRVEDCKKVHRCPKNQVWSDCPSSCPRTCHKPRTDACIQVCRKPGCVCKKGFVLKGKDCVPVEQCKY